MQIARSLCLSAIVFSIMFSQATAAKNKKITPTSTLTGTITKEQHKILNGKNYISDKATFEKIWKNWNADEKMPKIDFSKSLILIHIKNEADPNRHNISIMLGKEGSANILSMTTLIGFQPSNKIKYWLYVVPKKGIKGVKRYDRAAKKMIIDSIINDKKQDKPMK